MALFRQLLFVLLALFAMPVAAQDFPQLSGPVVDQAGIIPDEAEARLTEKLTALKTQSQRELVVVTLSSLQGYEISDYGYRLGRHWQLGEKQRNDGAILIVAPNERKLRIEVGYGLEPVLTDGLSSLIINQQIVPRFKAGDMPAGIEAGADAIITQLTLPADQAQQIAAQANAKPAKQDGIPFGLVIWLLFFFLFFVLPIIRRARRGRRYSGSGIGPVIVWEVLNAAANASRSSGGWGSSSGGGGGSSWGGGGGSFGGGGASGSW